MSRSPAIPSYRLHKPSGQARAIVDGRHVYLGPYGSPESRERYARLIAERFTPAKSNGQESCTPQRLGEPRMINEVLVLYWRFAEGYYVKEGKPTKELASMRDALRPLRQLYGQTQAAEFGPLALKIVRQHMIDANLSRGVVNSRINRIKRMFKWAVSEELVPPNVYEGLRAVAGLRRGRTDARETEPIRPAPEAAVEAVLPYVSPQVAAMIQLQRLTGMRSGELTIMRPVDIDRTGEIWTYEPTDHKSAWRGHRKTIPLGPKAQVILQPFLDRSPEAFLFSPREAEQWRYAHRPAYSGRERKTPVYPCELKTREKRKQARRSRQRKRPIRDRYNTVSYGRAIVHGIARARNAGVEIPHWHPHQLRHSRGTEIRKKYGIEAAQVTLGHARVDVTEIYAEKNLSLAMQIAAEAG